MPRILAVIDAMGGEAALVEVIDTLTTIGYPEPAVRKCVNKLMAAVLLDSLQGPLPADFLTDAEVPGYYHLRCTSAGLYYVRRLIKQLTYVQHMSIVTSLQDPFRNMIRPWRVGELPHGVQSAAALVAQIKSDEKREAEASYTSPEGRRIHDLFRFGRLAHDIAAGCRKSLQTIRNSLARDGRHSSVDWDLLANMLTPPDCTR